MANPLVDDLNRLIKPRRKQFTLEDRADVGLILGGRFLAEKKEVFASAFTGEINKVEAITIYSHLIITADGAFEMPLNWPLSGAYPVYATVPSPLPESMKMVSGSLVLDPTMDYYQQKRVHAVVWYSPETDSLVQDHMLVRMAAPFENGGEYYLGLENHTTDWEPLIEGTAVALNAVVQEKLDEFVALNISFS